jgi:arylamine N-acetyltransferase
VIDVDAYLARIGAGWTDSMASLHEAHVRSVPFENYDSAVAVVSVTS